MCIEQLDLILYDMYQMDVDFPNPQVQKKKFKRVSNSLWAIGEVKRYIVRELYPKRDADVDEFINITNNYIKMTAHFAELNSKNRDLFLIAKKKAMDVLEVLEAMR